MELYIKQKVFSWKNKFTVKDSKDNDRYYIEGKAFSFGHKLSIQDAHHLEVARIEEKVLKMMPTYTLYIKDKKVASIKQKLTFLKPKYEIEGSDITATGDLLQMNFSLLKNQREIASVRKAWFTFGDSYELKIQDSKYEVLALALVLAIDCAQSDDAVSTAN